MSKRSTETSKWEDQFFRRLSPTAKLLYWYMWDRCDIAGFWEIDFETAAFCIGEREDRLREAIKELSNRFLTDKKTLWLKTFLKHQKNANLKTNVKPHIGIIRKIAAHKSLREAVLEHLGKEELLEVIDDF